MTRILIAEHNNSTSDYLQSTLKRAGCAVTVATNCIDAWRVSSSEAFDILMVDIVMPGIDGFILAQRMLQENPDVQIVFITGFAGVAMDPYAAGSFTTAPVTTRPFHLKDIVSRVRYLMGQGGLPIPALHGDGESNVLYADFARKERAGQQQA